MASDIEVFRDTVNHRRPKRILYYAGFTPDLLLRTGQHIGAVPADAQAVPEGVNVQDAIARHYGMWRFARLPIRRPANLPEIDYSPYWRGQSLPEGTTFNPMGVAKVPSGFYHFFGYVSPLRNAGSLKEIENYPLDDYSTWDFSYMKDLVDAAHAEGRVVNVFCGHMYENAWQVRGYEQFLMDMIERPAWSECLLERMHQNALALAKALAAAGVDLLGTGDDVANQNALMFSPAMWREMILSRWAKVWQSAKSIKPDIKVWYHTDGNCLAIIDEMISAGLDILNPLQPECLDVDEVHRRWGSKLTLDGCIGTQSTMPWGTPQQVRARVKEVIDRYGRSGGLIISPTHVLEPEVPIANIEALFEACREFGAA